MVPPENSVKRSTDISKPLPRATPPLAVVGTVAIDAIKTPFGSRDQVFGGSGTYFSFAASFFVPVGLIAVVGQDFPPEYRKVLEERPIDLSHLEILSGKTFFWKGEYGTDLNTAHTRETQLNVLLQFDPQLRFSPPPPYLFLANIDPELQLKILDQIKKPKTRFVACDTMNFWIANKKKELLEVLARVDCVFLNDGEARQLTGEPNLVKAGRLLRDCGPARVVIKKGEHGVLLFDGGHFCALPAYPLETVLDPTGAGDSFAGALMGYLAWSGDVGFDNFKRAAAFGTITASFVVEDFGLEALRRIQRSDLEERLEIFRKISTL